MLKFSEWHHKLWYVTNTNTDIKIQKELYYIDLIDPSDVFKVSIHHTQNFFDEIKGYYINFSYTSKSEEYLEVYKKFLELQYDKNVDPVFDDIETAKEHVENFLNFLNKCMSLSAFL